MSFRARTHYVDVQDENFIGFAEGYFSTLFAAVVWVRREVLRADRPTACGTVHELNEWDEAPAVVYELRRGAAQEVHWSA